MSRPTACQRAAFAVCFFCLSFTASAATRIHSVGLDRESRLLVIDGVELANPNNPTLPRVEWGGQPLTILSSTPASVTAQLPLNVPDGEYQVYLERRLNAVVPPHVIPQAAGLAATFSVSVMTLRQGEQGPQGVQGVQGPQGIQGPQGEVGPQGPAGFTGATGPQGPQGQTGATGAQGPQGVQGVQGSQGETGAIGAQGPQGSFLGSYAGAYNMVQAYSAGDLVSHAGSTFVALADLAPGAEDPAPGAGSWSIVAARGEDGAQGEVGAQGVPGLDGISVTGANVAFNGDLILNLSSGMSVNAGYVIGPVGPQGATGASGAQGPQGVPGDVGAQGPEGPAGPAGQSVTTSAIAPGDARCPAGGVALQSASGEAYVCNGTGNVVHGPIITSEQIAQVSQWAGLPANFAWNQCYKGTRDSNGNGFFTNSGAYAFHSRCDNKGRSFFVAKTTSGKLFGGYTSLAWGSSCSYRYDSTAFLFSLTNNFKHTQTGQYSNYQSYSIYDCGHYGPTFGGGHDFYTNLRDYAHTYLGHTYACRVGSYGSTECRTDLGGSIEFGLAEMEVYTEN